jgi:ADP-heptose:LPS heptosyltransferase
VNIQRKQKIDLWIGVPLLLLLKPAVLILGQVLRRDHALEVRRDIVFLKFQGGGSLVIALPAILGLRKRYPEARFRLVTTRGVLPFAEALGVFDELVSIDDSSLLKVILSGVLGLSRVFRCDTLVDLEVYSFLSAVFGLGTLARNRLSFYLESTFWRRGMFTHLIFLNRFSGIYHFYEDLAARLGAAPAGSDSCRASVMRAISVGSAPVTRGAGRRILIGAGCSDFAKERLLSPLQWRAVLAAELRSPCEVVFLGGATDRELSARIIDELQPSAVPEVVFRNECGRMKLAASLLLLAGGDVFFGVDSGLLHFARLFGVPSVSFWGPTDPATRLKPVAGLEETVRYLKTACSPCVHVAESPPCAGANICIAGLFPDLPGPSQAPGFHSWPV